MRRIVTFFHSSSTATHILKEKQSALQLPEHKLIQDVRTRWNSSFDMMSRYLEQQPAIFATFHHKDVKKNIKDIVTLSETEKSEAEELVNILGPLKKMTTILCSEHSPTVSLVHPMREMLLREMARHHRWLCRQVFFALEKNMFYYVSCMPTCMLSCMSTW